MNKLKAGDKVYYDGKGGYKLKKDEIYTIKRITTFGNCNAPAVILKWKCGRYSVDRFYLANTKYCNCYYCKLSTKIDELKPKINKSEIAFLEELFETIINFDLDLESCRINNYDMEKFINFKGLKDEYIDWRKKC